MSQPSPLPASVTVRVPGSTSNCGAGFDTLGLALQIYNRVTLKRTSGPEITAKREEDGRGQKMVETTAKAFFAAAQIERFGFSFEVHGDVPPARGLGSSMTVIGGVSLSGGRGSILGTVLGALIFGVIISGFTFLRLDAYYQEMVKGGIIVGAVVLDQWRQRRAALRT